MSPRELILLDTNVASFVLNRRPELALYRADLAAQRGAISFQSAAEMLAGADIRGWGGRRRRELRRLFDDFTIVYPEEATLRVWGHLRAAVRAVGLAVDAADLWVAATALTRDLTLVAHDAVFRRIPGLRLICRA